MMNHIKFRIRFFFHVVGLYLKDVFQYRKAGELTWSLTDEDGQQLFRKSGTMRDFVKWILTYELP